ncbi:site-specific integrase [Methylotenera sp.]|uniref:tyrosine-type recombinase/integrase n=1 Tax=Methylotenera sp. TaxID=2051956 RepID=UPI0027339844|nr:site-specific integrase [Methylotenera sp.]MDP3211729.1 site-specific integrase [Methylotenera sp.]
MAISKTIRIEKNIYQRGLNTYQVKMRDGIGGWHIQTFFDPKSDSAALQKARDFRDLKRVSKNNDADFQRIEGSALNKRGSSITLGELLTQYKKEITVTKSDIRTESLRIDMLLRLPISKLPASRVDGEILRDQLASMTFRNEGKKPISNSTRVRYQTLVSHVYNIAKRKWRHKLDNPVRDMEKFQNDPGRNRRLVSGEFEYLYDALLANASSANVEMRPIFLLALGTGCRESENITHDWADVDWEHFSFHIHGKRAKNGEARSVPIFQQRAIDCLIKLHKDTGEPKHGPIFKTTQSALIQAFTRAVKRARKQYLADCTAKDIKPSPTFLTDLTFHDLRHEAASYLFEATDLKDLEIMQILGHKDLQTTKRYAHLRSKSLGKKILLSQEKLL